MPNDNCLHYRHNNQDCAYPLHVPPLLIAHSNVQPSFHPSPHHFHSCNTNQYRNMKRHSQVLPPDARVLMHSCNLVENQISHRDSNMLYCGWLGCHQPQFFHFLYIWYLLVCGWAKTFAAVFRCENPWALRRCAQSNMGTNIEGGVTAKGGGFATPKL